MHQDKVRGITSMLGAIFCFALMDACLKQLASTYPPLQVAFFRGAAGLPFVIAVTALRRDWRGLVPLRPRLHLLRGVLSVATLYTFVYALSVLSLADAYSIFLVAPLLVTALSVPMLHEQVGWRRWIAIAVGMIGALVILRPTGAGWITLGGMAALLSAVTYAVGVILIRVATRTDTASATVFWTLLVLTCVAGMLSLRDWVDLQAQHWRWIVLIGITGSLGQMFLTDAFRRCAAGVVAPFEYTALIWGIALDWLIWHLLPNQRMLSGAMIVVGSGLYVIYRENRKQATA
jgi:drug/metabolite transporter (DMT)-like permease